VTVLVTIGYHGKSLQTFVRQLQAAGVDAVIDIRLRNTSHLAGYTKRDDLAFLLRAGFGIAYEHRPELAPTVEILEAYRSDGDWAAYEARFAPLMDRPLVLDAGRELLGRYRAPCLLCAEPTAERCHRRLVAERLASQIPGLEVVHL
jgi:uncharacterized protein (DUF488 family)